MPVCECPCVGAPYPEQEPDYDPVTEWPFAFHNPGECRCINDLRLYHDGNGGRI